GDRLSALLQRAVVGRTSEGDQRRLIAMRRATPKTSTATSALFVHEPKDLPPQEEPLTVTVSKACQLSGLGATSIWKLIRDRRLESVRVAGTKRRLINYESLKRLLTPRDAPYPTSRKPGRPRKITGAEGGAP